MFEKIQLGAKNGPFRAGASYLTNKLLKPHELPSLLSSCQFERFVFVEVLTQKAQKAQKCKYFTFVMVTLFSLFFR